MQGLINVQGHLAGTPGAGAPLGGLGLGIYISESSALPQAPWAHRCQGLVQEALDRWGEAHMRCWQAQRSAQHGRLEPPGLGRLAGVLADHDLHRCASDHAGTQQRKGVQQRVQLPQAGHLRSISGLWPQQLCMQAGQAPGISGVAMGAAGDVMSAIYICLLAPRRLGRRSAACAADSG